MALIVDLYGGNDVQDFGALRRWGVSAAWLKATEGVTFNDPTLHDRVGRASAAGLHVGFYHYAHPERNDPKAEAEHFLTYTAHLGNRRSMRCALDYEEPSALRLGGRLLERWARTWNHYVQKELGYWPVFYSYPDYVRQMNVSTPIGNGLWFASYGRNDGREYPYSVPGPAKWKTLAHQFTSNARVPGVSGVVDLSYAKSIRPLLVHPLVGML